MTNRITDQEIEILIQYHGPESDHPHPSNLQVCNALRELQERRKVEKDAIDRRYVGTRKG